MTKPSTHNDLLETALDYAKKGLSVFPLHGTKDGKCTCDDENCEEPGAHPRVDDGTTDSSIIRDWWTKWPKAKIGLETGAPGIIAVQVETQGRTSPSDEWPQRTARWAEWEKEHEVPRTVMFHTGSHDVFLFRFPEDKIRYGELEIAEGVTVFGIGQYVRLPGSRDSSGKLSFYPTCGPGEACVAQVPVWLDRIINFSALINSELYQPGFRTLAVSEDMIGVRSGELDESRVRLIAESYQVTGIRLPLVLRTTEPDYQFELLSDPHEFEAMKLYGLSSFPGMILTLSELDGRLWQIAQLLNQPKLPVLRWAEFVVEWVRLVTIKAGQVAHPSGGRQPHDKGFSKAGRVLGVSRREVERAQKIVSICVAAKAEIRRLNLNVKSKLVQIGEAPEDIQLAMLYEAARDRSSEEFEDGVEQESPAGSDTTESRQPPEGQGEESETEGRRGIRSARCPGSLSVTRT
jgi:hypothetical protein